jgi:hypothetical protein
MAGFVGVVFSSDDCPVTLLALPTGPSPLLDVEPLPDSPFQSRKRRFRIHAHEKFRRNV